MAADELRVLQIIPFLGHGGLERVATSLALAVAPRVQRMVVCSVGGEPYQSELRAAGIAVELIPRPWGRPWPLVKAAFALARVLRRERPDVIHAHNPAPSAAAALARLLAGRSQTAIVTTYHGVAVERLPLAIRALTHSADIAVGVAPASTAALAGAGFPAGRAATILNAVAPRLTRSAADVRREFGAETAPLVVTVGRYVEEKNQALLLEALARLVRDGRRLRALLVGYGPLEDDLRTRAHTLGLDDVVAVTGERHDAADLIAAADLFVLSSDTEALPLVVLEAMSLGTPVVSTEVGAIGDVLSDGETGLLVPRADPAALAAAIERALADADLRERLVQGAEKAASERFSVDAMADAYLQTYANALARRQA